MKKNNSKKNLSASQRKERDKLMKLVVGLVIAGVIAIGLTLASIERIEVLSESKIGFEEAALTTTDVVATLTTEIPYENLEVGKDYQARALLVTDTGENFTMHGETHEGIVHFTPTETSGSISVDIDIIVGEYYMHQFDFHTSTVRQTIESVK